MRSSPRYSLRDGTAPGPNTGSDPTRRRRWLGAVRAGVIGRVVLSIVGVAFFVVLRKAPGTASSAVWLFAVLQCAAVFVIFTATASTRRCATVHCERECVTVVLFCLGLGALLELYGASQTATLFRGTVSARFSLTKLESVQERATWVARFASFVGLVGAVALALSLRATALWLGDHVSARRAATSRS